MGYLEDEVKRLQGVIDGVEARIKKLEERSSLGGAPKSDEHIRMILIGPPGAGMRNHLFATSLDGQIKETDPECRHSQARARKLPKSRRSSIAVTS
jgi:hypothetical protein